MSNTLRSNNRHLDAKSKGAYYAIQEQNEKLKDLWVAISSTDPDLAESLQEAEASGFVPWESVK